jgi:hypothetical protein
MASTPTPIVTRYARARRWKTFLEMFPTFEAMSVLDLGGTSAFWSEAPVRPYKLALLNLEPQGWAPWYQSVTGDVCSPSKEITDWKYDLVFSNSVIGHVGGHQRRLEFASVVHSCADQHWIQTPYRYFPIDPFMVFPGWSFLPVPVRAQVCLHWPHGSRQRSTHDLAVETTLEVEFLTKTEMHYYFPKSLLWMERLAGLPKSIVAAKKAGDSA